VPSMPHEKRFWQNEPEIIFTEWRFATRRPASGQLHVLQPVSEALACCAIMVLIGIVDDV
jgi:hypothetical protein